MEGDQGKKSCNNNDLSLNTYPSEEKKTCEYMSFFQTKSYRLNGSLQTFQ